MSIYMYTHTYIHIYERQGDEFAQVRGLTCSGSTFRFCLMEPLTFFGAPLNTLRACSMKCSPKQTKTKTRCRTWCHCSETNKSKFTTTNS